MSTNKSKQPSRLEAQRHPVKPEIGEDYKKLEAYVEKMFPDSNVNWTHGDPSIPKRKYQVHIVYRGLRIKRGRNGGLRVRTRDASNVNNTAKDFLLDLKEEESKGLEDLTNYIKKNFAKHGFVVECSGDRQAKYRGTTVEVGDFERHRVSVILGEELAKKHGRFILGAEYGPSIGIAARKVLELIQFKEENGFLWVNENLYDHAEQRVENVRRLKWLEDKMAETKNKELTREEQKIVKRLEQDKVAIIHELEKPLMWLGKPFKSTSTPNFFEGDLPKLSQKLHKTLQKNNLEPTKANAKEYKGEHLLTYDAVEAYEGILKQEPQKTTTGEKVRNAVSFIKKINPNGSGDSEAKSTGKDKGKARAEDPVPSSKSVVDRGKTKAEDTASTSRVVEKVKSSTNAPSSSSKAGVSKGKVRAEGQASSSKVIEKGKVEGQR